MEKDPALHPHPIVLHDHAVEVGFVNAVADVRLVPLYIYKTVEAFTAQMESYVHEALYEGLLGWQVTDCLVTMTDCGYGSPATGAADFRRLTQLVLATTLEGRHVGLRAAGRTRARGAVVDAGGSGGARPARGESARPGGYQPIGDKPPKRQRSRPSPLDRDAWLASLSQRG